MRIENEIKLDFCDVLIKPKRSQSPSRKNVNLNRTFKLLSGSELSCVPLIAANMSTTGTFAMAKALSKHGATTALHKHYPADQLIEFYNNESNQSLTWYSLGIKDVDFDKLKLVKAAYPKLKYINLDVANAYTNYFVNKLKQLREMMPDAVIMAGNVCSGDMVQELLLAGADLIKCGIGSGGSCLTRVIAGVGVPQFSCISDCADVAHGMRGHIVADGGCVMAADVVKAFGAGADFVMLGSMLAGTDESEGEWEEEFETIWDKNKPPVVTGRVVKKSLKFYGMSSKEAMDKFDDGQANYKASEGKCVNIPYKGPVDILLKEIMGGIRSACTYVGTEELKDFSKCCTFIRVNRTHNTSLDAYKI